MSAVYDAQPPGQKLSRVSASTSIYDCFPSVASNGGSVAVAVWRQATSHAADTKTDPVCRVTKDRGATWSPISVMVARKSGDPARSVVGVTWNPKLSLWIAFIYEAVMDSKANVTSRSGRLVSSTDGLTWTPYGSKITWAKNSWYFPSDIIWVDDGTANGALYVSAYGGVSGGKVDVTFVSVSRDNAVTWADTAFPQAPGSVSMVEPRFCDMLDGTISVSARNDNLWQINMVRQNTDGTWQQPVVIATQASGEPNVFLTKSGVMFLLCRDTTHQFVDPYNAHMLFKLMRSDDNGLTWTTLGDPTQAGKAGMYQGWCEFDNGNLLLVYGAEDDPSHLWWSASTFAMSFIPESLMAVVGTIAGGLPVVRVSSGTGLAYRQGGDGLWEQVRNVMRNGALVDAEAPTGPVTYAPSLRDDAPTVTVNVPSPQAAWLVIPDNPEASVMLRNVTQDGMHSWDAKRFVTSTDIPGAEAPFTIDHGTQGRAGTITAQCIGGPEYDRLTTALAQRGAKKLVRPGDYWPLVKVPDWVWVTDAPETAHGLYAQMPYWEVAIALVPATRPMVTQSATTGWASLPSRWSSLPTTWAALK